jgi:exodeoxyribonuclease V gamma subunit
MLRAVRSNRAEALLGALAGALPAADPFAPVPIVVGGHLVARWLQKELAFARGIAAGIELVTFDSFIERTWQLPALDQQQLAAAIASQLADHAVIAELPQVAAYLEGARGEPKRVQLAEHLAELAWQYAQTRPDWMPAFAMGRAPGELSNDATARWQAALIGRALAGRALVPMLPWVRRAQRLPAPKLATPVFVLGLSYLSRAQLEALSDLAAGTDVTVYLLDACEPLWDDVRKQAGEDPLPLALWGRALRDTLGALVERTGGNVEDAFVHDEAQTARARMMSDALERKIGHGQGHGHGVEILACPNPRREIEIAAAEIRARLDADPTLRAHDVAVWIAGEAARYLAQAPSAFEAVNVPCHLIDAPMDDRGRIGEAVLALLELPTSAMTRGDLLRVMTHPAVLAGHPHVDADDWIRWTERLGIVHGANADSHAGTYLAAHRGRFHWDQGVRRLALGAFMTGDREAVTIEGAQLAPEPVAPDQQASAATFALLVRSLCADASWLARHEAPLAEWADIFVGLVEEYLARRDGEAAREIERVRSMLAGIARVDLDSRRVGFREAREHAVRRLADARADRGEPLAAGVMVAPLAAMRAIPFRVAFVVGLDEASGFSAADRPSALDVRREPRAGDVSRRDRDRHAFLEVLLGTREQLWLSYVAIEAKSGAPLAPSAVVLELADALAPYLGAASSREALAALSRRVPLHRFGGPRVIEAAGGIPIPAAGLPPAALREQWAVRVRDAIRAQLRAAGRAVPDDDGMLALLAHESLSELRAELGIVEAPDAAASSPSRPLSLANVRSFLEWPVQAWAQAVLGLDELPDEAVIDRSDEPFHVDRPARATLLREVLAEQLHGGGDPGAAYDAIVAELELRGQYPVGVFGEAERAVDLRLLAEWREMLGPIAVGGAKRLAFGRSSSHHAELLPALELELSGGRTVRLVGQTELLVHGRALSVIPLLGKAEKSSRYHLRGALDHVVLAAAGLAEHGHQHVLLGKDGSSRRVEHAAWSREEARAYLAELVGELLDAPHGYLLPLDQLARALDGKKPAASYGERNGLGYGPIERADGLAAPSDAAAIARRRLAPLVARMTGDHGFGGEK